MKVLLNIFATLVLAIVLYPQLGFTSSHHESELAQASGTGHCNYMVLFQNHIKPAGPIYLRKPAWLLRRKAMA